MDVDDLEVMIDEAAQDLGRSLTEEERLGIENGDMGMSFLGGVALLPLFCYVHSMLFASWSSQTVRTCLADLYPGDEYCFSLSVKVPVIRRAAKSLGMSVQTSQIKNGTIVRVKQPDIAKDAGTSTDV